MKLLNRYEKDGFVVSEWTNDGVTITHVTKEEISEEVEVIVPPVVIEPQPEDTIEQRLDRIEQTTAYTQLQIEYLTTLSETNTTK